MSNSSLHPPNRHLLTDNVIGAVSTRYTRPQFDVMKIKSAASTPFTKKPPQQPPNPITAHSASQVIDNPNPITTHSASQVIDIPWNSLTTAEKALQMQRVRRRKTQQRYRKRLEGKASSLAEEISRLKAEVQHFELRLRCPPCAASDSTPWRAVVECFRLFRNGFQGPATTEAFLLPESHTQKRFLRATMAPNVAFNDGYGVDAILDNWRNYSVHHKKIQVQLVRLEQGADNLLIAYLVVSEVIPRETLLNCFGDKAPTFVSKLLGQELEVPTCVHFRWDEQGRHFDSVHYEVDMLTPLLKLLGNLEDASIVLNSPLGIA